MGKKVQLACYSNIWQRAKVCACCMWKQTHPVEKHSLPRLFPTSVHRNAINDGCKSGANHSVQHRSVFLPEHTSFRLFNDCFARTNLFIHMTKILPRFTRSSAHSLSLMLCFFWTLPRPFRFTYLPASHNPVPIKAIFSFFHSVAMLFLRGLEALVCLKLPYSQFAAYKQPPCMTQQALPALMPFKYRTFTPKSLLSMKGVNFCFLYLGTQLD